MSLSQILYVDDNDNTAIGAAVINRSIRVEFSTGTIVTIVSMTRDQARKLSDALGYALASST